MNSGVPLWLVLLLLLLTLAVAFGAAWYGARIATQRADGRWREEFQLQEQRWRREAQQAEARYWRDRRSKLYAGLLSIWRELNERFANYTVMREATKADQHQLEEARDQLLVIGKQYRDLAAEVAIEASHPLSLLCKTSSGQVSQFLALIMEDYSLADDGPRAGKNELQDVVAQLVIEYGQFDQQTRVELAVPDA